jgi:hypothetical protein
MTITIVSVMDNYDNNNCICDRSITTIITTESMMDDYDNNHCICGG